MSRPRTNAAKASISEFGPSCTRSATCAAERGRRVRSGSAYRRGQPRPHVAARVDEQISAAMASEHNDANVMHGRAPGRQRLAKAAFGLLGTDFVGGPTARATRFHPSCRQRLMARRQFERRSAGSFFNRRLARPTTGRCGPRRLDAADQSSDRVGDYRQPPVIEARVGADHKYAEAIRRRLSSCGHRNLERWRSRGPSNVGAGSATASRISAAGPGA